MTLAVERERVFTLKSIEKQREAALEYQKAHPVTVYMPSSRRQEVQETMSEESDESESVSKPKPQDSRANQTASAFSASPISSRPVSAQIPADEKPESIKPGIHTKFEAFRHRPAGDNKYLQ